MRNALVFFFLGIAIYSLWPAGPKDYLLNTLELFHDFLEQPSVDRNGRITTEFKAHSLSYTLRASSGPANLVRLRHIDVERYPKVEKPFHLFVAFDNFEDINDIQADVTISLGKTEVVKRSFDVCSRALGVYTNQTCPFPAGAHNVTASVILPPTIPRARYTIEVVLRSSGSERENRFHVDANFLFHGTWLAAYEHTQETLKAYIGRIAGIASNGFVGRKKASAQKKRVRQRDTGGLPHERVEL